VLWVVAVVLAHRVVQQREQEDDRPVGARLGVGKQWASVVVSPYWSWPSIFVNERTWPE